MTPLKFSQVDVFAPAPLTGNPLAVVHDAGGLTEDQMAAFARWTNLSETTFLLEPTDPGADYWVRIFTPGAELPFAGHPTLGSAHAWLERGGTPARADRIVQQCGLGLIEIRRLAGPAQETADASVGPPPETLAFRAPELVRSGPVDDATLRQTLAALAVSPDAVIASNWVDNGPGWVGVFLRSADDVLALRPQFSAMGNLMIGVIGAHPAGGPADYEVRAFAPSMSVVEDPVTGSVNAGLAVWLTRAGLVPPNYTVRQGTALQRSGDVRINTDDAGYIWVGGVSRTLIAGTVTLE
jgi:PhzF family phenazine biosynthesis protein